jgi:pyruvate formate lyase activating enzyme
MCILEENKTGNCGSRFNRNGKLVVDNFGELVSACIDPIEKKPLYHFYPGSVIFSIGANGCNFSCDNCQNWEISQEKVQTRYVSPENLAEFAGRDNSIGVAYTYTEPLIWFEYILQTGRLIKEVGLKNVLVTNGSINPKPLERLLPVIDAANVDLKSMQPSFYRKICKGKLEPVLRNIKRFYDAGVHLEITNLLITGLNDSDEDLNQLVDFVASISPSIPLHFSAYYPTYKMDRPPTSPDKLLRAFDIASRKLDFVFLGNVRLPEKSDSRCPKCRTTVISRDGYSINLAGLRNGFCSKCGFDLGIKIN